MSVSGVLPAPQGPVGSPRPSTWPPMAARSAERTRSAPFPAAQRLSERLFLSAFTIALLFSSDKLLSLMGFVYLETGGNFLHKIHPSTYLFFASFFFACWSRGNPIAGLGHVIKRSPAAAYFLATCLYVLVYTTLRHGVSGAAFIIDTLTVPAVCALVIDGASHRTRRRLMVMIFGFITLNGVIGILESATQRRLLPPWDFDDLTTFRGCGLFGHPLNSALVTGTVLVTALAVRVRPLVKTLWLGTLLLALLSFGGRTSFVTSTACIIGYYLLEIPRDVLRGRYRYRHLAGGIAAGAIFLAALVTVMWTSGVGRRIFGTMTWDSSADARQRCWEALAYLDFNGILFGIPPAEIREIIAKLGLIAIENFWLELFLQFGFCGFLPFVSGLAAVFIWAFRKAPREGRLALLLFLAIASANNSLSTKTCSLTIGLSVVLVVSSERSRRREEETHDLGLHRSFVAQ